MANFCVLLIPRYPLQDGWVRMGAATTCLRPHLCLQPECAGCRRALQTGRHRIHLGGGGVPWGAPPHGGGSAETAGKGDLHEDRGGGGDLLQPPAEQGINDPHEGTLLYGAEQDLEPQ